MRSTPRRRRLPAPPPADGTAESSFTAGRSIEELGILDLTADTTARYPRISPVRGAVFDPSGRQLLVQTVHEGQIVSVTGDVLRSVQLPGDAELGRGAAWSPDGSRVAVAVDHAIQLASRLIGSIGTRPSHPDRGPLPPAIGIGWAVLAELAAGLVTLVVLRRLRAPEERAQVRATTKIRRNGKATTPSRAG